MKHPSDLPLPAFRSVEMVLSEVPRQKQIPISRIRLTGLARAIVPCLLSLAWLPSHAGVIYSTGFEKAEFKVGSFGTGEGLKTQSGRWSLYAISNGVDLPGLVKVQSTEKKSGGQALMVQSSSAKSIIGGFSTEVENSARTVSFGAHVRLSGSTKQSRWQFAVGDPSAAGGYVGGVNIAAEDGSLELITANSSKTRPLILRDAWHHLVLKFDIPRQTYQVWVNGAVIASDVPFLKNASKVRIFQFATGGTGNDSAYFDDFLIGDDPIRPGNPPKTAIQHPAVSNHTDNKTSKAYGSDAPETSRVWTPIATGKEATGTLISKTPDNSSIVIKLADGREVTVKTASLIQENRDYVAKWQAPVAEAKGIVRGRMGGALSQAQGGKSRVMKDLQSVLSDYGRPEEDTKPHPDAFIYRGPAWFQGGGEISIPYLMPRVKALALLVQRPGQAAPRPALAPGFPPGMISYEYDIRFGVYNRMFVVVDQADQVVALQIKAETRNDPTIPVVPPWNPASLPMGSTTDFIEPRTGGAAAHVLDLRGKEKRIIIDLETGSMETLLFLPVPMIKLCLFHIAQDLRK